MAASEVLSVQGESTAAGPEPAAVPASNAAWPRWPQLIPIAQLVAVVLGVFAIIWNQQQTTDSLRTELNTEVAGLRADITRVETGLRAEFSNEIGELRVLVAENGERLARIEGFLGIGIPDSAKEQARAAAGDDLSPGG
ncbi:MAG: hypothetical protein F4Y99_09130 [Acidimicrobiaceae bacterium]|nr:hypothetical protein [Acidimicrobiaceae bacterium]MYF43564.1 hypothetical protein [Acidimicrobiaceae bacterium]MYJ36431.1 hypothetical protein [Acidimicrobiaceae bacterium]